MSLRLHNDDLAFSPAGQIRGRAISWLVPQRLALGQLALIEGDPDLGKSCLMLDLAARLSTGRGWPEGGVPMEPASAIYLSAEDGAEDTIVPRLQAAGADLNRIFVASSNDPLHRRRLTFPSYTDVLDQAVASFGAQLVVIDPVIAFLDRNISSASDESIRRVLSALARLAATRNCLIVLIRHLNKRLGQRALYRGGGSIGFAAHCRSGWLVGRAPGDDSEGMRAERRAAQAGHPSHVSQPSSLDVKRCVLAQQKNNNAGRQPSLLYELVAHASGYPVVRWLGTCSWNAENLVARPRRTSAGARRRARDFLVEFLRDGPRRTQEIWDAAFELDFSERTLARARKDAEIESKVIWAEGIHCCYWLLPGQEMPAPDTIRSQLDRTELMCQSPLDEMEDYWTYAEPIRLAPVVKASEVDKAAAAQPQTGAGEPSHPVSPVTPSTEPGVSSSPASDKPSDTNVTQGTSPVPEPEQADRQLPANSAGDSWEAERARRRALGLWVA